MSDDATPGGPTPVDLIGIWSVKHQQWLGLIGRFASAPTAFCSHEVAVAHAVQVHHVADCMLDGGEFIVAHISDPMNHHRTRVTAAGVEEIGGEDADDGFDPKARFLLSENIRAFVCETDDGLGLIMGRDWLWDAEADRLLEYLQRRKRHRAKS